MDSRYKPRSAFMSYHQRIQRWAILVAHRRAGKTVAAVNDVIEKALYNPREHPRYGYIAPMYRQAKDIAWQYLKDYSAPFDPDPKETELSVTLRALYNRPKITLYGADNPDAFRGMYFDGVVLDEFGNQKLSIWKEVLLPALIDRRGWATFMGTPNGPNHFRDMHYFSLEHPDEWHNSFLPVTVTGLIPKEELEMMQRIMDEEQFAQEMMCSFEASVRGAFYARQIEKAREEGRIGHFPLQRDIPTDVVMDLGFRDDSTMGFFQDRPDGRLVGHAASANTRPISFYIAYIKHFWKENRLRPGQIWLPHDARAKSLQTGKSIVEQFKAADLKPKIVPNLDLMDGISATRSSFADTYFHDPETRELILALMSYHREYDEDKKVYKDTPVHDWSSHYADMFRYMSLLRRRVAAMSVSEIVNATVKPASYGFALNDIWDCQPWTSGRIR